MNVVNNILYRISPAKQKNILIFVGDKVIEENLSRVSHNFLYDIGNTSHDIPFKNFKKIDIRSGVDNIDFVLCIGMDSYNFAREYANAIHCPLIVYINGSRPYNYSGKPIADGVIFISDAVRDSWMMFGKVLTPEIDRNFKSLAEQIRISRLNHVNRRQSNNGKIHILADIKSEDHRHIYSRIVDGTNIVISNFDNFSSGRARQYLECDATINIDPDIYPSMNIEAQSLNIPCISVTNPNITPTIDASSIDGIREAVLKCPVYDFKNSEKLNSIDSVDFVDEFEKIAKYTEELIHIRT